MNQLGSFLREEDGGISIEWVALAAGVALLALGIVNVLDGPLEEAALGIGEDVNDYVVSLQIGQ